MLIRGQHIRTLPLEMAERVPWVWGTSSFAVLLVASAYRSVDARSSQDSILSRVSTLSPLLCGNTLAFRGSVAHVSSHSTIPMRRWCLDSGGMAVAVEHTSLLVNSFTQCHARVACGLRLAADERRPAYAVVACTVSVPPQPCLLNSCSGFSGVSGFSTVRPRTQTAGVSAVSAVSAL